MINLSPSPDRIGRACVCILEHPCPKRPSPSGAAVGVRQVRFGGKKGRSVLMVSYADFFTFPGGGVNLGETFEQAATREAFEEAGATVKIIKFLFEDPEDQCKCYLAKLEHLEASPEGRVVRWVNALEFPWCEDKQIKLALMALELQGAPRL